MRPSAETAAAAGNATRRRPADDRDPTSPSSSTSPCKPTARRGHGKAATRQQRPSTACQQEPDVWIDAQTRHSLRQVQSAMPGRTRDVPRWGQVPRRSLGPKTLTKPKSGGDTLSGTGSPMCLLTSEWTLRPSRRNGTVAAVLRGPVFDHPREWGVCGPPRAPQAPTFGGPAGVARVVVGPVGLQGIGSVEQARPHVQEFSRERPHVPARSGRALKGQAGAVVSSD